MRKIFLLSTFYFLLFTTKAQIVFNKLYAPNTYQVSRNVVIQDSSYWFLGGSNFPGNNYAEIIIAKTDLEGNLLEIKHYGNDTIAWGHGSENSLKETGTGNYILGCAMDKVGYRADLLIKFDNNFDTIFTKSFYHTIDGVHDILTYGSNIDADGGYLFVGSSNFDENYNLLSNGKFQLIKTDTLGNFQWRKLYGSGSYLYIGYKVVNTYEGGYLIGGWSDKNGGDWCIVKTDANGENPIYKYYGSQWADGKIMGITLTSDSCYLVYGAKSITENTQRARIIKLNKNLVTQWDKLYDFESQATGFMQLVEKEDGNFVGMGAYYTQIVGGQYKMSIYNINPNGDIIFRQSTAAGDTLYTMSIPGDVKITPDSGYIFTGWATNSTQWTPTQQMWLVKTNQYGYDGSEWTTDTVFTGIEQIAEIASKNNKNLRVYPNPAKNTLFVELKDGASVIARNDANHNRHCEQSEAISLTIEQFNNLTIANKLKYNIAHPEQNFWGKAEKQELQAIANKLCYALPYAALNGEIDIFSIEPMFAMQVESNINVIARNEERMTKQSTSNNEIATATPRKDEQSITIYDIYGRHVKKETLDIRQKTLEINISNLQKGIYFVQVGNEVAKFIKL